MERTKERLVAIKVTSPLLPAFDDFMLLASQVWESEYVTNSGPMHQKLERELAGFLGVEHLALVANGTLALDAAIASLEISPDEGGEIITTPYSFVATAHAIANAGFKPVFVDIEKDSPNLDPDAVRAAITPKTKANVPVHCYGTACDVDAFAAISEETGIPIIYDAAHAFGVSHKGQSLLSFGDAATLSFHGTKVFNTFEGGAVIFPSAEAKLRCTRWRNFGYQNETTIESAGSNAKMNEICAAMGLASLPYYPAARDSRAAVDQRYRQLIDRIDGIECLPAVSNHAYFPVVVTPNFVLSRDELYNRFVAEEIFVRRYFFPLITEFDFFNRTDGHNVDLPNAKYLADHVICLPMHSNVTTADVDRVVDILVVD